MLDPDFAPSPALRPIIRIHAMGAQVRLNDLAVSHEQKLVAGIKKGKGVHRAVKNLRWSVIASHYVDGDAHR
jgi:hypothetical protein